MATWFVVSTGVTELRFLVAWLRVRRDLECLALSLMFDKCCRGLSGDVAMFRWS